MQNALQVVGEAGIGVDDDDPESWSKFYQHVYEQLLCTQMLWL